MKRLSLLTAAALLASTPLFAMDGGVSISGEANFGVKFKEHANEKDGDPSELQFHHEFKVTFAASGTTDGGIGFGGEMTLDNTESVGVGKTAAGTATPVRRIALTRGSTVDLPQGTNGTAITRETGANGSTGIGFQVGTGQIPKSVTIGTDTNGATITPNATDANGLNQYNLPVTAEVGDIVLFVNGQVVVLKDSTATPAAQAFANANWVEVNGILYQTGPDTNGAPDTPGKAAAFDPDASNKIDNHGEVYISMDMHKLTIGSDLDAADKVAGGLADPGFDGIGIDDVAEGVWGKSAADVRYDGDFGVASVAISYGDNKGDAEWAAGFSFNVEPVTVGAGFDSNGVMSIGMGFTQGQISMNALYSTDSDHDEADNEAREAGKGGGENTAPATFTIGNKLDLKNQAMGVDMTYQMSEATSLVLVAAQHKKEDVKWYYERGGTAAAPTIDPTKVKWAAKSSTTVDAFGVGFSHDLGGGATLKAGAGSMDSNAVADLGITMKF